MVARGYRRETLRDLAVKRKGDRKKMELRKKKKKGFRRPRKGGDDPLRGGD